MANITNILKLIKSSNGVINPNEYNSNLYKLDNAHAVQTQNINGLKQKLVESRYLFFDEEYPKLKLEQTESGEYRIVLFNDKITNEDGSPTETKIIEGPDDIYPILDGTSWKVQDSLIYDKDSDVVIVGFEDSQIIWPSFENGDVIQKATYYADDGAKEVTLSVFPQSFGGYYEIQRIANNEITWKYVPSSGNAQPDHTLTHSLIPSQLQFYQQDVIFDIDDDGALTKDTSTDVDGYDLYVGGEDKNSAYFGITVKVEGSGTITKPEITATMLKTGKYINNNNPILNYDFYLKGSDSESNIVLEKLNISSALKSEDHAATIIFEAEEFYWGLVKGQQLVLRLSLPGEDYTVEGSGEGEATA